MNDRENSLPASIPRTSPRSWTWSSSPLSGNSGETNAWAAAPARMSAPPAIATASRKRWPRPEKRAKDQDALFLQSGRLCRGCRRPQLQARAPFPHQISLLSQTPRVCRSLRRIAVRRLRQMRRFLPRRDYGSGSHCERPRKGKLSDKPFKVYSPARRQHQGHLRKHDLGMFEYSFKAEITSVHRLTEMENLYRVRIMDAAGTAQVLI